MRQAGPLGRQFTVQLREASTTYANGQKQGTDPQRDELRATGCTTILEERASGAVRSRSVLARLPRDIRPGHTLVVARLEHLARSVGHLLAVIEQFEATRSGADPRPHQGRPERGAPAATSGGNPGLRAGDPAAIYKLRASRDAKHLDGVLAELDTWLPTVRWVYPGQPWDDMVRVLNHGQQVAWTIERLRKTVQRLARESVVEAGLLGRARRQGGDDRLVRLVAGIKAAAPDRTLQQIATQLETMRERTPRGGTRWHPSSVKHLLGRAEQLGLAGTALAKVAPGVWR